MMWFISENFFVEGNLSPSKPTTIFIDGKKLELKKSVTHQLIKFFRRFLKLLIPIQTFDFFGFMKNFFSAQENKIYKNVGIFLLAQKMWFHCHFEAEWIFIRFLFHSFIYSSFSDLFCVHLLFTPLIKKLPRLLKKIWYFFEREF